MKKSCLHIFLLSSLLCLCVLFISCATAPKTEYITVTETKTETITETEYVPVYIDLNDTIKTVVDQKPDNSKYVILTGDSVKTIWGVLSNSWAYQCAWEDWQAYALLLEETLYICRDKCIDPSTLLQEQVEEVAVPQTPATPITESSSNNSAITVPTEPSAG